MKSAKPEKGLGACKHKLAPRLRMVANGDEVVNAIRAERACSIRVSAPQLAQELPMQREHRARSLARKHLPKKAKRGRLKQIPGSISASVFVHLIEGKTDIPGVLRPFVTGQRQSIVSASVPLDRLSDIAADTAVASVETGEAIVFSQPLDPMTGELGGAQRVEVGQAPKPVTPVLVGIVDVQGFDFAHRDFLDAEGKTRFVSIWDQGGSNRPAPKAFSYGSEITAERMNQAISGQTEFGLSATQLEPQSQMMPGSHGTHVASIAAGNHGTAPESLVAGVLISLPAEASERRQSFYDSSTIAHAVDYLFTLAETLGKDLGLDAPLPVSVNISLGTNGHAHDASSAVSRWLDYALATPGRSVCVAAGNAGQDQPAEPGDWGYVMGRIHTSGQIAASGLSADIDWIVVGDGIADLSENELEIWYAPQDRLAVQLRPPGAVDWLPPVEPGQYIENQELDNGTFISIYNERYVPANGANYVSIYLSPFLASEGVVGVGPGTWTVRLIGREVRDGRYHGWIERDDPRSLGPLGMQQAWSFPSFFSLRSNVDESSVSSLACGQRVVSVANLDAEQERIHITSSQGPTRDQRQKPEIAAPGTNIMAANGFDPEQPWISMTGTSMASPWAAGVIALALSENPKLTAAQIGGMLRRTARPLPGFDFSWQNDAGFGRLDAAAFLGEARDGDAREDLTP